MWRLANYDGPVGLLYIIGFALVTGIVIELADRIIKASKKKDKKGGTYPPTTQSRPTKRS